MDRVDVLIVGFGPGGEAAASLIGQAGHSVMVLDKAPVPYGQPRMSTLDGEIARVLQHAADPAEAMTDSIDVPYVFFFGADEELTPVAMHHRHSGHWSHYSLHQPNIESAMERRIAECPSVQVRWETRATAIEQSDDGVHVVMESLGADGGPGTRSEVHARYVLGFDGASSFVREAAGIELDVLRQHDEQWILTDFEALRPLPAISTQTQYHMNPARPWFGGPNGANRTRTDIRVMPGETLEDLLPEENGYAFIEEQFGVTRDDVRMTRRVTYRFRSHIARSMRANRVFIGGDAAHAMTPYMGQGACTAIRDAANLAWKLRLVLSGSVDEQLLDTYEEERLPHGTFFVTQSLANFDHVNVLDPVAAAARDAALREGPRTLPAIPGLEAGVLRRDSLGELGRHAGELAPQGLVRMAGSDGLLDNFVGYGPQLVTLHPVAETLGAQRLERLAELGVITLRVTDDPDSDLIDLDGTYRDFWTRTCATSLLARPDHYLFGLSTGADGLAELVDDFLGQLPQPAAAPTRADAFVGSVRLTSPHSKLTPSG